MALYEVFLTDDEGTRLDLITDFISLDYTLIENEVSSTRLVLPATRYSLSDFQRDHRLEIERNQRLEGQTPFLIRFVNRILSGNGVKSFEIEALSANHLLSRRWIAYYAGLANKATITDNRDDIMKKLVRYNLGSLSGDGDRDINPDSTLAAYFTVAADTASSTGSSTKSASRRPLLTVLQELALDAWQNGEWLGFDVVKNSSGLLEFRTYVDQRGSDHSSTGTNQVIFSPSIGNLTDINRVFNWKNEKTVVIAAGQNTGASRVVATGTDTRKDASVFNWIEQIIDARNIENGVSLDPELEQALRDGRPGDILTGRVVDMPGSKMGLDWDWGDLVEVEFENETQTARLSAKRIQVSNHGQDQIDLGIQIEN